MLEDIENWDIPESFLWIEIVKPEVFSIALTPTLSLEGEGEEQVDLSWEQLNLTWWVQKYFPETYLDKIASSENTIKVWVVDTWIDYNHPDLQGKVTQWYDFVNDDNDAYDDQWHGTHVAGTIWASINGQGIIWVNPYVELVPLKICNAQWFCPTYAVTQALAYAKENNIDILNMSLWAPSDPIDNPICDGIESATHQWIIVIAAAWNSNVDTSTFVPWWCADTITVSAIDQNNQRASFSNYGSKVDIAAPWVGIYSTYPNNQYRQLSWTSMATPHVVW
jgi:thermitase